MLQWVDINRLNTLLPYMHHSTLLLYFIALVGTAFIHYEVWSF